MAIPEDQLTTWSNPGGTANAIAAHNSIRTALEADDSPLKGKNFEVFLQGSYRNKTNIRADSDVDVVVQTNEVYYKDLSLLPPDQKAAFERSFKPGAYGAKEWRTLVEGALRNKFGTALKPGGGRAFHVVTGPGNMTADVLPAVRFKKYTMFQSVAVEAFVEGVEFADAAGNFTINYPKEHIKNGEAKNSETRTSGRYKPSVRMFKNARTKLIHDGMIADNCAPSYCVECLTYNAPDSCFGERYRDTFHAVVSYLSQNPLLGHTSQNGIVPLFGTASTQWNTDAANAFLAALITLWNDWG
jgi:hypothetical protein